MALRTDREKFAHMMRRFGLGASEAELDFYLKDGYSSGIQKFLNYENTDEGFSADPMNFFPNKNGNVPMPVLVLWWITRLAVTQRPFQEKMTLFWHDHFATSGQKVTATPMMFQQNETMRLNAVGKFQTLLSEVSKGPAMLFWLDNQFNVKGKPNENFAREIMELFTLGVGNYSEKDIQEAARAFTGWTVARRGNRPTETNKGKIAPGIQFSFNQRLHDTGEKSILGNKGNFDGDDVIGILCGNPQTSKYITTKIWEWFVYPNPEPKIIDSLASKFRDSGLDIKKLVFEIISMPEFFSAKAERGVYKNPVDYCVSTLRQLGVGQQLAEVIKEETTEANVGRGRLAPAAAAQQAMKSMGMELLFPPDVAGWEGGESWVSSATMVERITWADRMFPTGAPSRGRAIFRYPAIGLISDNPTPENLVDTLVSVFDAPVSPEKRQALIAAAKKVGSSYNAQTANQASNQVARLIFGMPEFQFA